VVVDDPAVTNVQSLYGRASKELSLPQGKGAGMQLGQTGEGGAGNRTSWGSISPILIPRKQLAAAVNF
jgi:hypothetical protein